MKAVDGTGRFDTLKESPRCGLYMSFPETNSALKRETALSELRKQLLNIARNDGDNHTAIPALSVHRRSHITDAMPCIYALGLAITVAGDKQVTAGGQVFEYGAGQALLASVDLPAVSRVTRASKEAPYLGVMVRMDPEQVLMVAEHLEVPAGRETDYPPLGKRTLDDGLISATTRLVALLDEPDLLTTVAPLIEQEIIARVLMSEQGAHLLHLNAGASPRRQIASIMIWLKQHFSESIRMDRLASQAHMSPSTFRQHFKAVAGVSPLQYLKQLRLQQARQLMLNEGLDAGESALRVGYESVSQFSREYARLFGNPPMRDVKHLRKSRPR